MTDEEIESLSHKHRLRGSILNAACQLVKTAEDRPVQTAGFHRVVTATLEATEKEVQVQVDYLVAAGYLEAIRKQRATREEPRIVGYRPTIKGTQLVEGDVADAAVEFKTL